MGIKVIEIKPSENPDFTIVNFETILDDFDAASGKKPVKCMIPVSTERHSFKKGQVIQGRTIRVNSSSSPYYAGQEATRVDKEGNDIYLQSEIIKL